VTADAIDGVPVRDAVDEAALAAADLVLVLTDHSVFDYAEVARAAPLVLDTRNRVRPCCRRSGRAIVRL
jgi:UDP-N-acetyl-D-mannosaminuronate dehydrogenase